jgi:hypothetical protein
MLAMLLLIIVSMAAGAAVAVSVTCCCWRSSAVFPPCPMPLEPTTTVVPSDGDPLPSTTRRSSPSRSSSRPTTTRRLQHAGTNSMAEELAKHTVKCLQLELKEKQQLVGGLKGDLVTRLVPLMADESTYAVAAGLAKKHACSIPLEALRSNASLTAWCLELTAVA